MILLTPIRVVSRGLLLATSLWLLAGPLALLQLGAWAWMLTSYSQESSFEQAVRETFGGERPCEMCKLITEVDLAENESPKSTANKDAKELKLLSGNLQRITLSHPRSYFLNTACNKHAYKEPYQSQPSPPPREFV